MRFAAKIVLLSGASGGIGAATAKLFAEEGARPAVVGRDPRRTKKVAERWKQLVPLQRMAAPEEIGRAILFLASSDASYITGTNLMVDGGVTCG